MQLTSKNENADSEKSAISNSQKKQQLTSVAIIQHSDVARNPQAFATAKRTPRIHGRENKQWTLVVQRCPFCNGKHSHGGGTDELPSLGHRVAHCATGPGGGYTLVLKRGAA